MNSIVKIGLIGGAVYGVVRLLQLKNLADKLTPRISGARIHKVDLSGLVFRTEVALNNPTREKMKITKPVVTVLSNGRVLTQSDSADKTYLIEPLKVTTLDTIEISLGWMVIAGFLKNILTRIPKIIEAFKQTGDKTKNVAKVIGIPIEMKFSTYANGIFYESEPEKIL